MNKKSNGNEFSSAFIIPHFSNECEENGKMFIAETVEGLFSQTDDDWSAIIVVDTPAPAKQGINDYLTNVI